MTDEKATIEPVTNVSNLDEVRAQKREARLAAFANFLWETATDSDMTVRDGIEAIARLLDRTFERLAYQDPNAAQDALCNVHAHFQAWQEHIDNAYKINSGRNATE